MEWLNVGVSALAIIPWFCTAPVTTTQYDKPPYTPTVVRELVHEIAPPGRGSCRTGSLPTAMAATTEEFDFNQPA